MSGTRVIVGFIPLLDSASLVAAAECGFAAAEGLDMRLVRETSWANIRDRVIVGQFDAAHMLGPLPLASSLGIGHLRVPMIVPMSLSLGGNAITVSPALYDGMRRFVGETLDAAACGAALREVVRERAVAGLPPLTFGMVYPFSSHNYQLRYWLAACGIDPDREMQLVVIPPPLLVDAIRQRQIDGFCVGEPWNSVAVAAGAGAIVTTSSHIWRFSPEKVLGLRHDWASEHADTTRGLVRAIVRAALWCDNPGNHDELARLLAGPRYLGVPAELLRPALAQQLRCRHGADPVGVPEFLRLASDAATFPWRGHAQWFYEQMVRWRQLAATSDAAIDVATTYRPDLYREAVAGLAVAIPAADTKTEFLFDQPGFASPTV